MGWRPGTGGSADPTGPAGGDLTGTYPNPTIGAQKVTASKLADPGTGKVWGSDGAGDALAVRPPGYQWDSASNAGAPNIVVSATSEGTPTAVVTGNAITYDGAAVIVYFSCTYVRAATGGGSVFIIVTLDGTTQGHVAQFDNNLAGIEDQPCSIWFPLTPSAGAHTISVAAYQSGGNGQIGADTGGSGKSTPAVMRVTKA